MVRWLRCCVLAALLLVLPAASALAEKRVALVIGNSNYTNVQKLPNPTRDASAIAALLKDAGFDVVEAEMNLTNVAMRRAVRKFTAIARNANIGVVYYAGHGIEVGGVNYLIPIDAQLGSDVDVEDETLSLDRIAKMLEPVNRLRLIILDACRENPFVRSMSRTVATRSITRGLAEIGATTPDTLVAFAAKAGSTAEDGTGSHSPFTTALLNNLTIPGLDVGLALRRVRDQVMKDTGGKQEPFVYGSLGGSIVALKPASAAPPVAAEAAAPVQAPRQPADSVVRDYEFAERIGTRQAWDSFLATHSANPAGSYFVALARAARDKAIAAEAREKATTQRGDDTRNRTELAAISAAAAGKTRAAATDPGDTAGSAGARFSCQLRPPLAGQPGGTSRLCAAQLRLRSGLLRKAQHHAAGCRGSAKLRNALAGARLPPQTRNRTHRVR